MNLERGFSAAKEKGDVWDPETPEKPVTTRRNQVPIRMQETQIGGENWQDLLGFYTDVLQDGGGCGLPPSWNSDNRVGINQGDRAPVTSLNRVPQIIRQIDAVERHNVADVAFAGSCDVQLPHSSGSAGLVGMNHWNQGAQDVPPVDKLRGLDQNARNVGSYLMNVSDVVPPRKVDSLAELLGMRSIFASSTTNPSSISQHSPIERNWNTCIEDGMIPPLQNHVLHANQDIGGHNLQQMPTSRVQLAYRPSYNLNSPLRSEAWESSSIDRPFHLVPATQDPYKLMNNNQISQIPHLFMGEISTNENIKQNLTPPQEAEIGEERNDFVSDTLSTASPNISTTKEKQNLVGKNGEFDLNKTPPQKAPKRKKHRPKVVVEGKPRRTPKSAAKENKNASGNTPPKRKYVRRKGIQNSKSQTVDAENDVEVLNSESQGKTCKRALKFELESGGKKSKCQEVDKQTANNHGTNVPKSSNLDFLNSELERKGACTMEAVHQSLYRGQRQTENTYNFGISLKNDPPHQQTPPHADKVQPTTSKDHTLNIIARNLNVRNTSVSQYGVHGKYGQTHHTDRGPPQLVISVNASQQNLDGLRPPRRLSTQLLEDLVDKQEPKRAYSLSEMIQPLIVSQMSSRGLSDTGTRPWLNNAVSSRINTNYAECKSNGFITEDFPSHNGNRGSRRLHEQPYELYMNGGLPYVGSEEMSTLMNPTYETNKVTHHWCMNSVGSGLKFQKMEDTKPIPVYEEHANSSLTTLPNTKMVSASSGESKVIKTNEITDAPSRVLAKRPYTRRKPTSTMSSKDKLSRKGTRNLQDSKHDLKTVSGSLGYKRNTFHIDDIIYHMKNLKISINGNGNAEGEHSALVPYTGDGATVPYEAFDPVKKRRPRPKVDLDPETNKLWNLLMGGNEANESAETMDENKQKWWEEERTVFRGRVDSFIARMHLVQGDRRFSKWKGSVVDSVIGVFLTQNVSDHLSSSAFMSLAAKFPIKSTHTRDNSSKKSGNPSAEYVVIRHPDGTTFHQRITKEPVNDHSSVKSSKLCEYGAEYVTSGTFSANTHTRTEEDMISSQSLSATMSFPASEDIRSSSGSNSEVEDQVNGSNFTDNPGLLYTYKDGGISAVQNNQIQEIEFSLPDDRPSNDHQQIENPENRKYTGITVNTSTCTNPFTANVRHHHERPNPISKDSWQGMLMGIGDSEIDVFAFSEKECTSALTSTLCDTTSQTVTEDLHDKSGQSMKNSHVEQQNGSSSFQPAANHQVLTKPFQKEVNLPEKSERRGNQYIINNSDKKPSENITFEPTEMKTVHASNVQSSEISTTSTARKQKAEKEKVKPFDWDTLRQQVLKGGPRGRSRETLDSLDYEALRNADVLEISNTIKERGMNNMLAARMKDFLNRLVKDHGSIDLEWLRDAQPDRVKDYLLSIRGLGLKSVECVRLLTLHHLAFPVDTNVGRIAVRLGWVPLQPLPESLQLHLLEMYPVLESIQKYLWPRLCMLDQETLYELHYQLITFGKVFCTKRQPNCNGCPMRGECRHFASAFASARHALPGQEKKRMVCSDIPTSSSKICGEVMRPMPLPPPEEYIIGSSPGATRNCEPIVEEPTTPESSIEITERDIEDAFYEDPDEIPEIKLNIEEFTTNLQSFIQENKELQESDMSKAIISLSPQLASIPMPKLKHVSRLRTEHHVYELPDSHPLLEGMDRREPDDPSPYLLALWTPGETADSIQPPEGKCSSSEGGLCNEKICFSCNSTREAQAQSVRGTILIPCRTAMRGSFPLNGTYFQVNEVFADHETSRNPIDVPRSLIWNLPRRTVFFGTSVSTIFKGMSTEGIQYCFWKGFVCVRGFDQKTRAPRPLTVRLHRPPSRIPK